MTLRFLQACGTAQALFTCSLDDEWLIATQRLFVL
jgi:hypothetical protein